MEAINAADHIVLPVFINQHAALDTETVCGGANFHCQIATAGKTFALDIQAGLAGMLFKEFCQAFSVQHGWCFYP